MTDYYDIHAYTGLPNSRKVEGKFNSPEAWYADLATSPGNMWSVAAAASTGEVAWFWAAPSAVGRFRTNAGALRDRRKSKGEASSSSYFPLGTAGAYRRRFSGGSG